MQSSSLPNNMASAQSNFGSPFYFTGEATENVVKFITEFEEFAVITGGARIKRK